jgi:rfaE bifunctional protein nucleotidyltransferase chain/domain
MNAMDKIKKKIYTNSDAAERVLGFWRRTRRKIVFTNGCFDLLHRGHIDVLSKASDLGNKLVIGLNSDNSVRRLKGPTRPIQDEYSRALILASLGFVDMVIFFSEDTPYNLIKAVKPRILVKGGDYRAEDVVGYDLVTNRGGKVIIINLVEGYSTTGIVNRTRI